MKIFFLEPEVWIFIFFPVLRNHQEWWRQLTLWRSARQLFTPNASSSVSSSGRNSHEFPVTCIATQDHEDLRKCLLQLSELSQWPQIIFWVLDFCGSCPWKNSCVFQTLYVISGGSRILWNSPWKIMDYLLFKSLCFRAKAGKLQPLS